MAELYKPTFQDHKTGKTKQSRLWYARVKGKRVPLGTPDKRIARRKAEEYERQLELGNDPTQQDKARRRPIVEHVDGFEESLRAKGVSERHLETLMPRISKTIEGCGLHTLANVDVEKIEAYLARQQRLGLMSAQTRRHYAVALRQFGRWLVAAGRAARNPFVGLHTNLNVQADRRHVRRALTHEESGKLLTNVRVSKIRRGRMRGPDRYFVYALALGTGLRRNELGSLTPEAFDLDAMPPTVTVCGAYTKNRKQARLPLRRDLAEELRPWLAGKTAGQPLFPIKDKQINLMIRADLAEAGIPFEVAGRVVDFHALRVTFVTHLALAGVPLATAQKLARHSDPRLTANTYTFLGLADLSQAVESLPPLPPSAPDASSDGKDGQQEEPPLAAAG